jgi:hypothetical protein
VSSDFDDTIAMGQIDNGPLAAATSRRAFVAGAAGAAFTMRAPGQRLEWDAEDLEIKNMPELNQFVRTEYRQGWTL